MQPPYPPQNPPPGPYAPPNAPRAGAGEILLKVLVPPSVLGLLLAVFILYESDGRHLSQEAQAVILGALTLVDLVLLGQISWKVTGPPSASSMPRGLRTFLVFCGLGLTQLALAFFMMFAGCACLGSVRGGRHEPVPRAPAAAH